MKRNDEKVTVAVTGWTYKATLAPRACLIYCASPSDFWSFLLCPPELSGNYQRTHLVEMHEKLGKKMATEFFLRNISLIIVVFVNIAVKSDDMGSTTLLPLWRNSCYGFLSPLKIHRPRPGLNPLILAVIVITLPVGHQGWRRTGWWRGFPFRISSTLDCLLRPSACAHENGGVVPLNGPLPALSEFDPSYIIIVTVCKIVVLDFTHCLNYTI
jgi:hypothetical protein